MSSKPSSNTTEQTSNPAAAGPITASLQHHRVTLTFGHDLPSTIQLANPQLGICQIADRLESAGAAIAAGCARINQTPKQRENEYIQNWTLRAAGCLAVLASSSLACLVLMLGTAGQVRAQEIQPYEFTPLPAGTNLAIGYYVYGHNTEFNVARGPTIKNSGLEINVGVARYVHFYDVAGHPAGIQVIQGFGSLSAAHVDGQRVGSAYGVQDTALSAFIWPYVNIATKTNFNTTAFLYLPSGSYDRSSAINLGANRWGGDIQLGLTQGIGERFAFDAEFDARFNGDNGSYIPGNRRLSQDPTYRVQLWANWRWSAAFTTSIGYEGLFGGLQQVNGVFDGNKTEEQRIRANAALFLTPTVQTMLELNHDVHVVGGFKQDFGATVRLLKAF